MFQPNKLLELFLTPTALTPEPLLHGPIISEFSLIQLYIPHKIHYSIPLLSIPTYSLQIPYLNRKYPASLRIQLVLKLSHLQDDMVILVFRHPSSEAPGDKYFLQGSHRNLEVL